MVRHQSAADNAWLPFHEESRGTQTLFRMAPSIVTALQSGSMLVIDELEASLHPLLALQVVRHFNDPRANPRNAQLLFTTHDTNLLGTELGEPALPRDQIWLTEKDEEGATDLYPLTDYKPRKAENLERGYLQGRYGAIPFLGPLARVDGVDQATRRAHRLDREAERVGETFRNPTTGVHRLIESIARVEPPAPSTNSASLPPVEAQTANARPHGSRGPDKPPARKPRTRASTRS
uniref:ATPase AAA-type core domain-containing protein n=1 Tax=Kofleria flava TaxID=694315 RepID=A0A3S7UYP8_9BACT|nr:hypothetical protein [Kofleria flava]